MIWSTQSELSGVKRVRRGDGIELLLAPPEICVGVMIHPFDRQKRPRRFLRVQAQSHSRPDKYVVHWGTVWALLTLEDPGEIPTVTLALATLKTTRVQTDVQMSLNSAGRLRLDVFPRELYDLVTAPSPATLLIHRASMDGRSYSLVFQPPADLWKAALERSQQLVSTLPDT